MNNYKKIIENNPSVNNLTTCLKQLRNILPNSSMLQKLAVATWWTGKQPKIPGFKKYTINILDRK